MVRRRVEAVPLSNPVAGWLRDVSPAGFGVETGGGLPVNQQAVFTLGDGGVRAAVRGTVRWCRFAGTRRADGRVYSIFLAGIRFSE